MLLCLNGDGGFWVWGNIFVKETFVVATLMLVALWHVVEEYLSL